LTEQVAREGWLFFPIEKIPVYLILINIHGYEIFNQRIDVGELGALPSGLILGVKPGLSHSYQGSKNLRPDRPLMMVGIG